MAMTVTATESGASASHGVALLVRVLTNAAETGGASGASNNTGGGTAQGSLTPNFSGSYVAFSVSADNVNGMPAAAANNTYDLTTANPSDLWSTAQGHYSGTVTGGTPLTYGAGSAGAGDHENWCAYEIPANGGTITLDGSSPAGVLSGSGLGSGTAATTASFTPPVGSVIVAEVCAGGTGSGGGITMTMSSTGGLVWTQRAVSSASDNFQPTWVFTATVPQAASPAMPSRAQPGRTWTRRFQHPQQRVIPPPPPAVVTVTAGLATAAGAAAVPNFPLYIAGLAGGTAGHFVDQHGSPRLYFAGVPWGLPANAGRWNSGNYQLDFDTYFADIAAQGMTAAEMHPWGHSHTGCNNDVGNTWDSVSPWTTIPTLNSTFWQRIDYLLNSALAQGITVFLDLTMQCDMGMDAFSGTGVFNGTSASTLQTAATNIATRYAGQPNLIYMFGDDYNNNDDTRMSAVLTGLRAGGYTGPIAVEYYSSGTTSRRDLSGSPTGTQFPFGGSNANFNWCYYYNVTYFAVEQAYKENSQVPVVWGDGFYVGGGAGEPADTHLMRNFVWWALASGARGCSMGSESILNWQSTAFTDLTVNQHWYVNSALAVYTAFSGFGEWYNLLPDTASSLVTAGRGTRAVYSSSDFQAADLGSDNYVAASVTPDKSLAVIYCAVAMSITIDQTKIASGYTATWVDPANGATQSAATGSTYASSGLGSNSAGNADWVLVLQGPASVSATAGLASGTGAAQGPVPAVGVNAVLATGTGAAQSPAAAAGVNAVLATGAGAAQSPVAAAGVNAAAATGTGTAKSPVAAIGVNAAAATGTGTAQNATASTSSGGSANAVLASGTGTAQPPATAGSGLFRLMDGVAGRPGNGPGSPSGAGTGNFIAGMLWKVTANGLWLTGYWHWVPAGGDTIPKKFALWQLTDTTHGTSQALVPAGTVTSGTMTAGAWNYVPLPAPIGLSGSVPYCVAVGWVVVNGFPDTQNQFGSGNTYAAGITSGPVFAYSDQGGSATEPYTSNYNQGLFSVASADPAAVMPTTGDVHSNFWVDVQVSYLPPSAATYRLWPSQPYATGWVDDTADNFTLGCEFTLNQPCVLGKLWFYSQPGVTQLPTECGIWNVATQSLVSGTDNASPSWSGAAGSGWVSVSYTGVTLPAGDYKAAVLNAAGSPAIWNPTTNGYWGTGPGVGGVNNGPVGAPDTAHATAPGQDTYNLGASFTYPLTFAGGANGANYWVDVEVTPLTAGLATGTGAALNPAAAAGVNAVLATGTGAALNATASTSAAGTANAVLATGAGAAQSPVAAIGVNAGLAQGAGTAKSPVAAVAVNAGLATGAGAALNATASTSSSGSANAVPAAAAGTAQQPVPAVAVIAVAAMGTGTAQGIGRAATTGLATGTGAAQAPTAVLAAQAQAQAAHALAAALNATGAAVEPFTVGTLTASDAPGGTAAGVLTASDQRTGGPGG